jgi:hypothetical protein
MFIAVGLNAFMIIFWLISFAFLAARMALFKTAADNFSVYYSNYDASDYSDYYGYKRDIWSDVPKKYHTAWQCGAAAAGLGGLEL